MRYKLSAIIVLVLASLSIASAFTPDNVDNNVARYNSMVSSSSALLRDFIGDQSVDVNVINPDGSVYKVGFVTQNAQIVQTVEGGVSSPTVVVNATSSAIDAVNGSNDPVGTFQEQRKYGQINIEGTNTITSLKLAAVLSSGPVLEFFYNVFYGNSRSG